MKPREAVIAVTDRCNARCQMCNIWRVDRVDEMEPRHYAKLSSSLKTINITGGEPFIRKDLVEVVRHIHSSAPASRIVFSTNGFLTETILAVVAEVKTFLPGVGVGVSIDGPEETHDAIRGVKGAFRQATSTIAGLKKEGLRDLRIGMILMNENAGHVAAVYELSKRLGVAFNTTFVHNSEIFYRKSDNVPPGPSRSLAASLDQVRLSQLRSGSAKEWFKAYHTQGIMDAGLRKGFISRCKAGSQTFFMSPSGDVFPCFVMNMPMGNLRQVNEWEALFKNDIEEKTRRAVLDCREDCWTVCNTRSLIASHPIRAGLWVAKNKLEAHWHRG